MEELSKTTGLAQGDATGAAVVPGQPQLQVVGRPSRVRYGVASVLRWSERLVDRVVRSYSQLFCLDQSDTAEIYMRIGSDYAKDGKHEDAVAAIGHTLALQPHNAEAWFHLGVVHLQQEATSAAVEAFTRAEQEGLDSFELHFLRAEAYADLDRHEEAVAALYRALELQPEAAEAAYRLGVALDQLKRYEEAVAAFKIAIAQAPREVTYYQSIGLALESLGQRKEAIKYFKRAVELERRVGR